jgi:uncharacterized membrane protein YraQ (UPF0718 family)
VVDWKREWKWLAAVAAVFAVCYWLPVGWGRFDAAVGESLHLVKWYAQEHVLTCLVPAFFIAGAISVFVSRAAVMRYLGPRAARPLAYGVASVSGSILAVCSCTVLPLFAGIRKRGAGLGPAVAFLYSGPAINVLAIVLTARVLGPQIGIARAVGAICFSVVIGLLMQWIFGRWEKLEQDAPLATGESDAGRPLWQTGLYFAAMVGVLVFANWGEPAGDAAKAGMWTAIHSARWILTSVFAAALAVILVLWFGLSWWKVLIASVPAAVLGVVCTQWPQLAFGTGVLGLSVLAATSKGELEEWFTSSWGFARQILPLLFAGVLVAGLLLGSQQEGAEGLVPRAWVAAAVGGNSLQANLLASVSGALMYFATLTEVPILAGLRGAGMGKGPALALLLAGPALSLPNMLVIRAVMGTARTFAYVLLVVVMSTLAGWLFGAVWG